VLVTRVGFVGAGQMGLPMVRQLMAAGNDVQVYARRPDVRAELADLGAVVVDSAGAAAQGCPVVIACLFSDSQLLEAALGPHGLLTGMADDAVLATHVTGAIETVRHLAAQTSAHVVDAPVSGTAADIGTGQLTVMLGGDGDAVERCRGVMAAYATELLSIGPLGAALAVKLVNNLLFAAHAQLAVEAIDLAAQLGVAKDTLLSALAVSSGHSYAASTLRQVPTVAAFTAAAGPFLRKDIAVCEQELTASGVSAPLLLDVVRRGPMLLH
jgi:3-hydroxyisobutyrate dehydrogenase-like beta-hydroxyacid dehydrogenase